MIPNHPISRPRLIFGLSLFVTGFAAPAFIPVVNASDLPAPWKVGLSGMLAVGVPEIMMIAAVAVMGKAGYAELKRRLASILRRYGPPDTVGSVRYRIGLIMFCLPLLLGWLGPYVGSHLPGYESHLRLWNVGGDVVLFCSLFVLGGDFWDKLRALFDQQRRAVMMDPSRHGSLVEEEHK